MVEISFLFSILLWFFFKALRGQYSYDPGEKEIRHRDSFLDQTNSVLIKGPKGREKSKFF